MLGVIAYGQNVGIGTPSPASKLSVNGNLSVGANYVGTSAPVNGAIIEGNVGIGTNSPDPYKLSVKGYNAFTDPTGSYNSHFPYTDNNAYISGDNIYLRGGAPTSYNIILTTQASTGNVGIGTVVPTQRLHVQGNMRLTGALYDSNNQPGAAGEVLVSTGTATAWQDPNAIGLKDHDWYEIGTSNPPNSINDNIYTNGNVGIGTNAPAEKLDVNGRVIATYGFTVRRKDTTLSDNSIDIGTYINNLLSQYDYVRIILPAGTNWTWNEQVRISGGKQVIIYNPSYVNGNPSSYNVTINITSHRTYTNPNCNSGNPTKDLAKALVLGGASLQIIGVQIIHNVCDTRPAACPSAYKGIFSIVSGNNGIAHVGSSRSIVVLTQCVVRTSEPVISIGAWARADVFFGWTWFYKNNDASCPGVVNVVQYDSGWSFSGGEGVISTSHTTLDANTAFESDPHLRYLN